MCVCVFAGYYCPVGSIYKNALGCPIGNYCPGGDVEPLPCRNNSHVSLNVECTMCKINSTSNKVNFVEFVSMSKK